MMVPVFGWLMDHWSIRKVALPGIAIYAATIADGFRARSSRSARPSSFLFDRVKKLVKNDPDWCSSFGLSPHGRCRLRGGDTGRRHLQRDDGAGLRLADGPLEHPQGGAARHCDLRGHDRAAGPYAYASVALVIAVALVNRLGPYVFPVPRVMEPGLATQPAVS